MVRIGLQYASTVWDLHLFKHVKDINELEKVKPRGGQWISSDYNLRCSNHPQLEDTETGPPQGAIEPRNSEEA